jgi:hypothetical protein
VPFRSRTNMQQFWAFGRVAVVAFALAGCQFGGLGGFGGAEAPATDVAAPSALQGPAVEVTTLAPIGQEAVAPAAPATDAEAKPLTPLVKTPGQLACEAKGGRFVALPSSGAMTCQFVTRDGGKQCRRESDCDGVCLARSNSCAPIKPLLGCQDILQDDGRRVELCID